MKTKHPMRGLLIFSFHAALGNASFTLLSSLALMVSFLATGNVIFFNFFAIISLLTLPMLVVSSLASNDGKWERLQLTMPIKRGDLLGMQYLSVLVSLIIPVILVVATIGTSIPLQRGEVFDNDFLTGIRAILPTLAMPFLMTGMLFPLATTKLGQGRGAALVTFCQFFAIAIILLAPWASDRLGISFYMVGTLLVAISVLLFIFSYFFTRIKYAKMDF